MNLNVLELPMARREFLAHSSTRPSMQKYEIPRNFRTSARHRWRDERKSNNEDAANEEKQDWIYHVAQVTLDLERDNVPIVTNVVHLCEQNNRANRCLKAIIVEYKLHTSSYL